MEALYWFIVVVMIVIGIIGTIVPVIPGTACVFLGLLLGAWIDGFEKVGWITITILLVLTLSATAIDLLASSLGAKRVGASKWAVIGAGAGTLVGLFFGIPGIVLGPFVGATLAEYFVRRDVIQAGKAGVGTWVGLVFATATKIALIFSMIATFILAYLL